MNYVFIAGWLAGDAELRTIANGSQLLNFDVCVDGDPGRDPIVAVAFFPRSGDPREIAAGARVVIRGELRHRRDVGRLFIAAHQIEVIAQPNRSSETAAHHGEVKIPTKRALEEELWRSAVADARPLEAE